MRCCWLLVSPLLLLCACSDADEGADGEDNAAAEADDSTSDDATDDATDDDANGTGDDDASCACLSQPVDAPSCDCSGCEQTLDIQTALHVDGDVDYGDGAPAGGDHASCWGEWGVHETPLPPENFVHNLEHGGVAFLYDCDDCDDQIAELEAFVEDNELTILTAFDDMDARFAVVSWGYRLEAGCLDMDAFEDFYDTHVDRAPEQFGRPPPGPPEGCF